MLLFSLRALALERGRRLAPEQVTEIQRRRLRSLVRRAVEGSAFYREKYRGIDLGRFALADLPATNKRELMEDFDRVVTDQSVTRAALEGFMDDPDNTGRLFLDRYVASHTSGSQGQPMLIVQDRRSVELFFGLQMTRGNADRVSIMQMVRRLLRPKRLAIVMMERGVYPSATLFQHVPAAVRQYVDLLWLSHTDPDVVDRLNGFRPEVLTAYPGVLEMLALEAEAGKLRLAPELRQVVANSEVLTDRARAQIETAFGLHVMNNYASGECAFLSTGCPTDDGAHVNADWAVLEVVDDHYRPVPAGTPGQKVLITNLANSVLPFIRYEVDDIVTMADIPCRCGSRLPLLARIEGRAADIFWVGEGSRRRPLINAVFVHAFDYLSDLREWQAVQIDSNSVLVRLEPLPGKALDLAKAQQVLDQQLRMYDFQHVRIQFEIVPHLAPDPNTGKFRRMVGPIDPGNALACGEVLSR